MIVSGPPPGSARQTPKAAMASVFDLTRFSVTDMVVASGELRQAASTATTMEDASRAVVGYLRSAFTDPATGRPAFALARMFHTVTWDRLSPDLHAYIQHRDPEAARSDDGLPYLTLLATEGDHPHWADRRNSRDHQAIPLSASDVVRRAPLALALLDRLLGCSPPPRRFPRPRTPAGTGPARAPRRPGWPGGCATASTSSTSRRRWARRTCPRRSSSATTRSARP